MKTIGNQQVISKDYFAGLFEGEGSICIAKVWARTTTREYQDHRLSITITNTDPAIIQVCIDYLKANEYKYFLREDKRKGNSRVCWQISITKARDRLKFVEEFENSFYGVKRKQCALAHRFMTLKMENSGKRDGFKNEKGQFIKDNARYSIYDDILDSFKSLKSSSETTRETPIQFNV